MVLAASMLPAEVISATYKSPVTPKNPAIFGEDEIAFSKASMSS
jgi:hypothetical protein